MYNSNVSVVIPFFNRSSFLERTLDSVLAQKLKPREVFVVDNGSSKEEYASAIRIASYKKYLSLNLRCVSTEKSGNANYARNLGYSLASTKYVAYLDSDDWWEASHLIDSIEILSKSNAAAVYSGAIIHQNNKVVKNFSTDINFFDSPFDIILSQDGYIAMTPTYVVDKEKIGNIVLWDENLRRHQDYDYFSSIFYKTEGWCYCPEANVNVDWNEGGTKKKDVDFDSLIYFCKKWGSQIPDSILKPYLLTMLKLSYDYKTSLENKKFYRNMMNANGYFSDSVYKIQAETISILAYNNVIKVLNFLRIKKKIQSTIKFLRKNT